MQRHVAGGSGIVLSPTRARYSLALCHSERSGEWSKRGERHGRLSREVAARESGDERVKSLAVSEDSYCFGGSGIVLSPTRAKYSSACSRSVPARSMILSRLSIDETSSSCSVRNHWRKLIVM